jgi:hypothetical protein
MPLPVPASAFPGMRIHRFPLAVGVFSLCARHF